MFLKNAAHNPEPQTRAYLLLGSEEWLEQAVTNNDGNTGPTIADAKPNSRAIATIMAGIEVQAECPAGRHGIEGIRNQVYQYLPDLAGNAPDSAGNIVPTLHRNLS